jgi:hypothetical protein
MENLSEKLSIDKSRYSRSISELFYDTLDALRGTWRTALMLLFVLGVLPSLVIVAGFLLILSKNLIGGLLIILGMPIIMAGFALCAIGLCELIWGWLNGEDLDFEQIFALAKKRFWSYIATTLIYSALLMVPIMVISMISILAGPMLYILFSFVQQIVVIFIAMRMISLLPIVVFEDLNPWESIQRAWRFTASPYTGFVAKRFFALFGIFFAVFFVLMILVVIYFVTFGKSYFASPASATAAVTPMLIAVGAIMFLVGIPFMIYSLYFYVLLYMDIRRERGEEDLMGGADGLQELPTSTPNDPHDLNHLAPASHTPPGI